MGLNEKLGKLMSNPIDIPEDFLQGFELGVATGAIKVHDHIAAGQFPGALEQYTVSVPHDISQYFIGQAHLTTGRAHPFRIILMAHPYMKILLNPEMLLPESTVKITRKQLRKLIKEATDPGHPIEGEGDDMYRQKFISLIEAGDLASAELLAESLGIDLFPMVAYHLNTVNAVLGPLLDDQKVEDYLYAVADGSFYEAAFFPTSLQSLQNFPSLLSRTG